MTWNNEIAGGMSSAASSFLASVILVAVPKFFAYNTETGLALMFVSALLMFFSAVQSAEDIRKKSKIWAISFVAGLVILDPISLVAIGGLFILAIIHRCRSGSSKYF